LLAGLFGIGAVFGGIMSGYLGSKYGRRKSLMLLAIPDLIGWILVASSQNLAMMLTGRFLAGFAAAGYSPNIQIFVAEIAERKQRGWLAGLTILIMAIGVLVIYALGSVLPWHLAAAFCITAPILLVFSLIFYMDSPYWYLTMGDEESAIAAMRQFRGKEADFERELDTVKKQAKRTFQVLSFLEGIRRVFTERKYFESFMILNILFLFMLFSGKFAIEFYAVSIFQDAGGNIDEYLSAVMIGCIHLLGSFLFLPMVKRYSRKLLLVTSSLVMGLSLILLGLYLFTQSHDLLPALSDMKWLPLACIILYMLAAPIGLCSIPFMYVAEFFPAEVRKGISILIQLFLFICYFLYPKYQQKS
jgi:MFS family permease